MKTYFINKIIPLINKTYYTKYNNKDYIFPITKENYINFLDIKLNEKDLIFLQNDLKNIIYTKNNNYEFKNIKMNKYLQKVKISNKKITHNINFQILKMNSDILEVIEKILKKDKYKNKSIWIVGGSLRDILNDKKPKDFDFTTNISYKDLKKEFLKIGYKVNETGKHFLVLRIKDKFGNEFEFSQLRKDKDNKGGIPGTLEEDAERRDFTIGTLYFDLKNKYITDPTGIALEDILEKILRFNGDPVQRIIEDPLRIIRFYRFISKGFQPDKRSLKAVRQYFEYGLKNVAATRIMEEIEKIVMY